MFLTPAQEIKLSRLAGKYRAVAKLYHNVLNNGGNEYEYNPYNTQAEFNEACRYMPTDIIELFADCEFKE